MIGRAARHSDGHVIMYADTVTRSMKRAIDETYRRRSIQNTHNLENGIVPQGIRKAVKDITERVRSVAETRSPYVVERKAMSKDEIFRVVKDLESQMKTASRNLEFEKAALIRDQIVDLRKVMAEDPVV
jgi:excinuclease ABC subunit B